MMKFSSTREETSTLLGVIKDNEFFKGWNEILKYFSANSVEDLSILCLGNFQVAEHEEKLRLKISEFSKFAVDLEKLAEL